MLQPENWTTSQRILVILAHPDDPEFFCGATIARWIKAGHEVRYCLLTRGDKGSDDPQMDPEVLAARREIEQRQAAAILGVKSIAFMDRQDGYLVPDLALRRDITAVIRQVRPDIVVTGDPTNLFPSGNRLNHPDHRAAGLAVLDAVFPAAGNYHYFPDLMVERNLEPAPVKEVWVSNPVQPTVCLDVTEYWELKIKALLEHKSQIGDSEKFIERMRNRRVTESTPEAPRYEERFHRIILNI